MVDSSTPLGKLYAAFKDVVVSKIDPSRIYNFLSLKFDDTDDEDDDTTSSRRNLYKMFVSNTSLVLSSICFLWLSKTILVTYYEFFNKRQQCNQILHLLESAEFRGMLGIPHIVLIYHNYFDCVPYINEAELPVFKMLASMPPHVQDDLDALKFIFSYEARERVIDCSLGTFHENIFCLLLLITMFQPMWWWIAWPYAWALPAIRITFIFVPLMSPN